MSDLSSDPVAVKIMQLIERKARPMRRSQFLQHFEYPAFDEAAAALVEAGHLSARDVRLRSRPGRVDLHPGHEPLFTLVKPLESPVLDELADAWERLDKAMALRARADKAVELALHDIRVATRAAGASDGR